MCFVRIKSKFGAFRSYHFYQEDTQMAKKNMEKMLNIISHQGNASQNHNEIITSGSLEWLLKKKIRK